MDATETVDYEPLTDAAASTTAFKFWDSTMTTTIAESAVEAAATSAVSSQSTASASASSSEVSAF
jgi:hypothetical protein